MLKVSKIHFKFEFVNKLQNHPIVNLSILFLEVITFFNPAAVLIFKNILIKSKCCVIQQLYMITIGIRKNSCNTAFCYQNVAIFTVLCDNPELSQSDYQSNDVSKITDLLQCFIFRISQKDPY